MISVYLSISMSLESSFFAIFRFLKLSILLSHYQAWEFSGFYQNSSFPEKNSQEFDCWNSSKNDLKVRELRLGQQKGAIVLDLFIMEYFPGLGKCIFSGFECKNPRFPVCSSHGGVCRRLYQVLFFQTYLLNLVCVQNFHQSLLKICHVEKKDTYIC